MEKAVNKLYTLLNQTLYNKKLVVGKGEDKRVIPIPFNGGLIKEGELFGGTFSTSDPEIQEALEANVEFNQVYKVTKRKGQAPVKGNATPVVEKTIVEEATTVQVAGDWLRDNVAGVKATEVNTKAGVLTVAKEKNIEFPNLGK